MNTIEAIDRAIREFAYKFRQVELISKLWIAFDGKASAGEKAEHTR